MSVITGTNNGETLLGTADDDTVYGLDGNDTIKGFGGDDTLYGDDGDDHVYGGSGNDTIYLGTGADYIDGGNGNDTLIIDLTGSVAVFDATIDLTAGTVSTPQFPSLDDTLVSIENVTVWGDYDIALNGSNKSNVLETDTGNDWIHGRGGDDEIQSGNGRDKIYGGSGDDFINSGGGKDKLFGGAGDDYLLDFDGTHADRMIGGAGNDYLATISNVGGGSYFDGGDGIDMISYANDTLGVTIDLAANTVTRGGISIGDTILNFENAQGTITGDDTLYGTSGNNILDGRGGDDYLHGRKGDDQLVGLSGNDVLDGGAGIDMIRYDFDDSNGGTQGIVADLAAGTVVDTFGDTDTLISIEQVDGSIFDDSIVGNNRQNRLLGNQGDDYIHGKGGSDDIWGGSGDDILKGGKGGDHLIGGAGKDILTGGSGADNFLFFDVLDSENSNQADVIKDFEIGVDSISLRGVQSGMTFIGTSSFSGTQAEVRYSQTAANKTLVRVDADGDGVVDMKIILNGLLDLSATDFNL